MNKLEFSKYIMASIFLIVLGMTTSIATLWYFSDKLGYSAWIVTLIYNIIYGAAVKLYGGFGIMKLYVFNENVSIFKIPRLFNSKKLCLLLLFFCIAYQVEASTVFSDDFNRADSNTLGGDWTESGGVAATIRVNSNMMYQTGYSSVNTVAVNIFGADVSNNLSYKFQSPNTGISSYNVQFMSGATAVMMIRVLSDQLQSCDNTACSNIMAIADNIQYQVDITPDFDIDQYDVFVNGVLKSDNEPFQNAVSSIDRIQIVVTTGSDADLIIIDDIYVFNSTGEEADTTPPTDNNDWNCTSCVENKTIWRKGETEYANTTDSTPSLSVTLSENANCSLSPSRQNYTTAIAENPAYKCSTTETTSMVCTYGTNLNYSNQSMYFSCIDSSLNQEVLAGLNITLDNVAPSVTLNEPSDAATLNYFNVTINATAVDDRPAQCNLYSNFTGNWAINQTVTYSNNTKILYNITNLAYMTYRWNVQCNDTFGNTAFAASNYTFTISAPRILMSVIGYSAQVNVTQHEWFSVTVNVTCRDSDCGDINVSLDPFEIFDRNTKHENH